MITIATTRAESRWRGRSEVRNSWRELGVETWVLNLLEMSFRPAMSRIPMPMKAESKATLTE
jgi:hypothetical protein